MANLPDRIAANISNFGKGLSEVPSEIYKYPMLAANRLATVLSGGAFMDHRIKTDIDIQKRAEQLKPMNAIAPGYAKYLEQQPDAKTMNSLAQATSGLLGGVAQGPKVISATANYLARRNNNTALVPYISRQTGEKAAQGTSSAAASEYKMEPALDSVIPKKLPRFVAPTYLSDYNKSGLTYGGKK